LVCAFAFVVMLQFSLPPSDGAYGIPMRQLFSDPLVFFGAIYGGTVCGVVSFPFAYFAVRNRRLLTSALFIFGVVILEILFVTPFAGWVGLVGSVPALSVSVLVCRFSWWKWFVQP